MVHKDTSSSYRSVDCIGLDFVWFIALCPSASVSLVLMVLYRCKKNCAHILLFTFSELSLVGLALDLVD